MTDTNQKHSGASSYRELLVEKRFLNDLLTALWPEQVEVLKPEVDIAGYDLVLEARGRTRHVQLKSSVRKILNQGTRSVRGRLCEKPAGCVLCIVIDDNLAPLHYRWFGSDSQTPLPDVSDCKRASRPGTKKERPDTYIVPSGRFEKLRNMETVIERLFGPKEARP